MRLEVYLNMASFSGCFVQNGWLHKFQLQFRLFNWGLPRSLGFISGGISVFVFCKIIELSWVTVEGREILPELV